MSNIERIEELLIIKRSEEDPTPLELTVNKRVSPQLRPLLCAPKPPKIIPGIGRLLTLLRTILLWALQGSGYWAL